MTPADKPLFWALNDEQALTLTLYGECRGESREGQIAVASVILHRAHLGYFGGKTIKEVCFKPFQFSCFNATIPEYRILLRIAKNFANELQNNDVLLKCNAIAKGIISGDIKPNLTASFYHTLGTTFPEGFESKLRKVAVIGDHVFFVEPGDKLKEA